MFVVCSFYFFEQITESDKVSCDHEAYAGELTHVAKVGIGASYGLIWVCPGIELIEYTEMFCIPVGLDDVKYPLTAACLGLEEAISCGGVGEIKIEMDVIERLLFCLLIEPIPCLL